MTLKTRLEHLEQQHHQATRPHYPMAIFYEEPTDAFPHAANGLTRAEGETADQWIERYQRELGWRALVIRINDEVQAIEVGDFDGTTNKVRRR